MKIRELAVSIEESLTARIVALENKLAQLENVKQKTHDSPVSNQSNQSFNSSKL